MFKSIVITTEKIRNSNRQNDLLDNLYWQILKSVTNINFLYHSAVSITYVWMTFFHLI